MPPNIDVMVRTQVTEAHGSNRLESLTLFNGDTNETTIVPAAALFLFIGAVPHSEMVADVVETNSAGFVLTGRDLSHDGQRRRDGS